jgi:exopolyphosphatase/guanosine-5'-triphosphate,3'-diphosphate pyrophosphatase
MQLHRDVSQVRSQRNVCCSFAGSGNSTHARGKSSATSGIAQAYGLREDGAVADQRLGLLDVGSNTVHLLVVDASPGARPLPAFSHSLALRLAELTSPKGKLKSGAKDSLVAAVREALRVAEDQGVERVLGFATSAIRDAGNATSLLKYVREQTGVTLDVLPGEEEARLTFLATRRWYGWSAGRLLVVDIGGGSLELAVGADESPEVAVSLPLGAGRLHRERPLGDPASKKDLRELRAYVRRTIAAAIGPILRGPSPDLGVGTSKTIRSLARIAGAAPYAEVDVRRTLDRTDVQEWLPRLAAMTTAERADLPGVSPARAPQLLAGAIVVDAAMHLLGIESLDICPWALREGVLLRHIDAVTVAAGPSG